MRLRWKLLAVGLLSVPSVLHDIYHIEDYLTAWHARDIPVLGLMFGANDVGFYVHAIIVGTGWLAFGAALTWLIRRYHSQEP
jgi:hypothetical protein